MPEKRKKEFKDNRPGKKSKTDIVSVMLSDIPSSQKNKKGSDSEDSDDDTAGVFSAFDLPNYDSVFNDGGGSSEDEKDDDKVQGADKSNDDLIMVSDSKSAKPGSSKDKKNAGGSSQNKDIIFLSDPSQLPNPIMFKTPTVMNPVVLGKPTANTPSPVILTNNGPKGTVPHIQPVLLSKALTRTVTPAPSVARNTRSSTNLSTNKASPKNYDTHVAVPVSKLMAGRGKVPVQPPASSGAQLRGMNRSTTGSRMLIPTAGNVNRGGKPTGRTPPAANALASAAASAVAAGMSATSIMQQVALAAQQAAKNSMRPGAMPTPGKNNMRPLAMSTPNKQFRNVRPNNTNRPYLAPSPVVNGGSRNPNMRNGTVQNNRGGVRQPVVNPVKNRNGTAVADVNTSKWKPYSQTLLKISRSVGRIPGYVQGTQPNLKQMYSMLRQKFSTKQIYDMCLWDLEHADASLMEIAIMNAFT